MDEPAIKSVAEVTREIKQWVESKFAAVWVQGEVSNCTRAGSGHIYLTLKDESAQLRAVIWRSAANRLKFDIENGLEVVATGPIELYQPRGTYQLIVERMIPQGVGALELAFRQMQQKLAAEGLFDPERKQPLPRFPRRIALITSPTGAAVRDMLQVITRRWHAADILVIPVPVQGEGAAAQIATALNHVHRIPQIDVVITGRGGGSLEDLWAFNEEVVARAILACPIPVISAVGHEIDVSIADLVADYRALTPSEAGEIVVPNRVEIRNELHRVRDRLTTALREKSQSARMRLDALTSRAVFTRPLTRIHDGLTRLDEYDVVLHRAIRRGIQSAKLVLSGIAGSLEALSPLKVLERGYSITTNAKSKQIIRNIKQLQQGDSIVTILAKGRIASKVEVIEPNVEPSPDS